MNLNPYIPPHYYQNQYIPPHSYQNQYGNYNVQISGGTTNFNAWPSTIPVWNVPQNPAVGYNQYPALGNNQYPALTNGTPPGQQMNPGPLVPLTQIPEIVHCRPRISEFDVTQFIRQYYSSLSDENRQIVQSVNTVLFREQSSFAWRDASIQVNGHGMTVTFISGNETNKYVISLNENNEILSKWERKGWRKWFTDGCISVWKFVKRTACAVRDAVAGVVVGRITGTTRNMIQERANN